MLSNGGNDEADRQANKRLARLTHDNFFRPQGQAGDKRPAKAIAGQQPQKAAESVYEPRADAGVGKRLKKQATATSDRALPPAPRRPAAGSQERLPPGGPLPGSAFDFLREIYVDSKLSSPDVEKELHDLKGKGKALLRK